jgi:hypothetical protein
LRSACLLLTGVMVFGTVVVTQTPPPDPCANLDQSPPPQLGSRFTGRSRHDFNYWSDAANQKGAYAFRHFVQNLSKDALTFEWVSANFARADVPSKAIEKSSCRGPDGNLPNVLSGVIRYGPNVQFGDGPDAQFYEYRRGPAPPQSGAVTIGTSQTATVRWTARTAAGGPLEVNLRVVGTRVAESQIQYDVINEGAAIVVQWPVVFAAPMIKQTVQQNDGLRLRPEGLELPAARSFKSVVTGTGPIARVSQPLTVRTADEQPRLLYRDVFVGIGYSTTP